MKQDEMARIAKRNPGVNLELLRKAQKDQRQIVSRPPKYDLEAPFAGQGARRALAESRFLARVQKVAE